MDKDVFISHASKDRDLADKICSLLEDRGISCWIAPRDIIPGKDYGEEIIRGIEETVATVLVLSENANESTFVKKEIERAVSKSRPVFPVRIREVTPSPGLELFISSAHWIDAWQAPIDGKINQLANSIKALIGQPLIPDKPKPSIKNGNSKNTKLIAGSVVVMSIAAAGYFAFSKSPSASPPTAGSAFPSVSKAATTAPAVEQPSVPSTTTAPSTPSLSTNQPPSPAPSFVVAPPPSQTSSDPKSAIFGTWSGNFECTADQNGTKVNVYDYALMSTPKETTVYFSMRPNSHTAEVRTVCFETSGPFSMERTDLSLSFSAKHWIIKKLPENLSNWNPWFYGKLSGATIRLSTETNNGCKPFVLEKKTPNFEIPAACRPTE